MAKSPRISAQERQWRAQDALSTLTRANEIQRDKALMAEVKKVAEQQVKNLKSVAGATTATSKRSK